MAFPVLSWLFPLNRRAGAVPACLAAALFQPGGPRSVEVGIG